jgi:hypothetical protein
MGILLYKSRFQFHKILYPIPMIISGNGNLEKAP